MKRNIIDLILVNPCVLNGMTYIEGEKCILEALKLKKAELNSTLYAEVSSQSKKLDYSEMSDMNYQVNCLNEAIEEKILWIKKIS